jgi:hypothetical protein
VTTPAPEKVASAPAPASDAPSVTASGTAVTAAPLTTAESSTSGFEIVVASFHTGGAPRPWLTKSSRSAAGSPASGGRMAAGARRPLHLP